MNSASKVVFQVFQVTYSIVFASLLIISLFLERPSETIFVLTSISTFYLIIFSYTKTLFRKNSEIVVNSIDHDGMMKGFDIKLAEIIFNKVNIPMTIVGGAGSKDDLKAMNSKFSTIGLGVGSFFVFKGRFRAVLISYPSEIEKNEILNLGNKI